METIQDTHVIVNVVGEVDLCNIADFSDALDTAAEKAPAGFIVDLSGATYIDSAGVQAMLAAYAKLRRSHGVLAVAVGNPRIRSVLEVVHLEQVPGLFVCPTLDQAREALSDARRAIGAEM